MKSLPFYFISFAFIALAACCKPEPPVDGPKGEIVLNFKAVFDNNPLVLFNNYSANSSQDIQFHVLNYLISEIQLVKTNNQVVHLKDVAEVNFIKNSNTDSALGGTKIVISKIDTGSYKSIRFGMGVSPSLNATEPGDHSAASPLGDVGNYWTAWNSYIFSRLEGIVDTLPGVSGGNVPFLYHSGVDGMYESLSFNKNFNLAANQSVELVFKLETKDFFYKAGAEVEVKYNNVSHSGNVGTPLYNLSKTIHTNLANALSIQ